MSKHSPSNLRALLATPTPAGFSRAEIRTDCDTHVIVLDRRGDGCLFLESIDILPIRRRRLPPNLMLDPAEYEKMNEFTKSVTGKELIKPAWVGFMEAFQAFQRSYRPLPQPSTN